jgi:hypothetical protein
MRWSPICSWRLSVSSALAAADVPEPNTSIALAEVSAWVADWVTPLSVAEVKPFRARLNTAALSCPVLTWVASSRPISAPALTLQASVSVISASRRP